MAILPIDGGRYGTPEMLAIFGGQKKVDYQLAVEAAAASAQADLGMIPRAAAADIRRAARPGGVTESRIRRLEARSDHDTAALVEALGEKCRVSTRPWIHYGLTSNDLVDTSTSLQMRDALSIVEPKTARLAVNLSKMADRYRLLPAVGRTHGQHASIISFGLKFANWAAEMARHLERIAVLRKRVLICKMMGVVGTGSMMGPRAIDVQKRAAARLGLFPSEASTQVVPRERHAEYVFQLALMGATLEKMAVEVRNLQRTEIGEVSELFRKGQMGSSAVPVKRNPTKSERVSSLSRLLRSQVSVSFENIPLWHERDLSNSANERFTLPLSSILLDEMLVTMTKVMAGLSINEKRIRENLDTTGGRIYAEFVLEALVKKGVPRMRAYRDIQRVAFAAAKTGYMEALMSDRSISSQLSPAEIRAVFSPESHLGASSRIISGVRRIVERAARGTA
ncbi:adenylosuccinate lyase [Cenarchaeum symbiosum A]|uniref:Adenylosuccinate lyase n=1 Tax=Cenarchaeum symbiosum (strain A) TaxID=414004 RepID=A0RWI2_CENSY|nr:adenylosuccinate lyase [Cenarchaeum symbiosum A]